MKKEEINFGNNDKFSLTMIPGKFTKAMRTNVIWQFFRFIALNIKMIIIVGKSH